MGFPCPPPLQIVYLPIQHLNVEQHKSQVTLQSELDSQSTAEIRIREIKNATIESLLLCQLRPLRG